MENNNNNNNFQRAPGAGITPICKNENFIDKCASSSSLSSATSSQQVQLPQKPPLPTSAINNQGSTERWASYPTNMLTDVFNSYWPTGQFLSPPITLMQAQRPNIPIPVPIYYQSQLSNGTITQQYDNGTVLRCIKNSNNNHHHLHQPQQQQHIPNECKNNMVVQFGLQCINQTNSMNNMNTTQLVPMYVTTTTTNSRNDINNKSASKNIPNNPGVSGGGLLNKNIITSNVEFLNNNVNQSQGITEISYEITRMAMLGCELAEHLAYSHRNRPCFKKIDSLCARMKQDLIKPDGVLANINSQGVAWAVKDFIFVFTRIINAWIIIKGYVNNTPDGLAKVRSTLNDGFDQSFMKWQASTKEFVEHLIKSFVNLDQLVQNQRVSFQKFENLCADKLTSNDSDDGGGSNEPNEHNSHDSFNQTLNYFTNLLINNGNTTNANNNNLARNTNYNTNIIKNININNGNALTNKINQSTATPSFSNNINISDNNTNSQELSTLFNEYSTNLMNIRPKNDDEELQRNSLETGSYFKTGIYNPLQKENKTNNKYNNISNGKPIITIPNLNSNNNLKDLNVNSLNFHQQQQKSIFTTSTPAPINSSSNNNQDADNNYNKQSSNNNLFNEDYLNWIDLFNSNIENNLMENTQILQQPTTVLNNGIIINNSDNINKNIDSKDITLSTMTQKINAYELFGSTTTITNKNDIAINTGLLNKLSTKLSSTDNITSINRKTFMDREKWAYLLQKICDLNESKYFHTTQFTNNYFPDFQNISPYYKDLRSIVLKSQTDGYKNIYEVVDDLREIIYSAKGYLKRKPQTTTLLIHSIKVFEKELYNILSEKLFSEYDFRYIIGDDNSNNGDGNNNNKLTGSEGIVNSLLFESSLPAAKEE